MRNPRLLTTVIQTKLRALYESNNKMEAYNKTHAKIFDTVFHW